MTIHNIAYLDLCADQLEAKADVANGEYARKQFREMAAGYRRMAAFSRRIEAMHKASQEVLGRPVEYKSRMVN